MTAPRKEEPKDDKAVRELQAIRFLLEKILRLLEFRNAR